MCVKHVWKRLPKLVSTGKIDKLARQFARCLRRMSNVPMVVTVPEQQLSVYANLRSEAPKDASRNGMIPPVVLTMETAKAAIEGALAEPVTPLQPIERRVAELARPVVGLEGLGAAAVAAVFPIAPIIVLCQVAARNMVPSHRREP